jgi:hypothetical protein
MDAILDGCGGAEIDVAGEVIDVGIGRPEAPAMHSMMITRSFLFMAQNTDIKFGQVRHLNLCAPPFSLPPPFEILREDDDPATGRVIGVWRAAMSDDGTLSLHLRLTSDGKPVEDTLIYKVTDRAYDNVLRHLGGINPGETKQFRPWKD